MSGRGCSCANVDRDFFDTFIVGDNIDSLLDVDASALTPASVRRIHDNARAMLQVVADPDVLSIDEIQNFVQYLMLQVSLIEVSTDSYQAAHRIFSVLNTRGVPLSAADIFKARVLSHVDADARPRYREPVGAEHRFPWHGEPGRVLRASAHPRPAFPRQARPH